MRTRKMKKSPGHSFDFYGIRRRSRSRSRSRSHSRSRSINRSINNSPPNSKSRNDDSGYLRSSSSSNRDCNDFVEQQYEKSQKLSRKMIESVTSSFLESKIGLKKRAKELSKVIESRIYQINEDSRHNDRHGGPIGCCISTVLLPLFVLYINLSCSLNSCTLFQRPEFLLDFKKLFNLYNLIFLMAYILFEFILFSLPIGSLVEGPVLLDGSFKIYRRNGIFAYVFSVITFASTSFYFYGTIYNPSKYITQHFYQFLFSSTILSFILSFFLYTKAKRVEDISDLATKSDNPFYNFFMGKQLNPRFTRLGFDIKYFLEFGPGYIGFVIITLAFWISHILTDFTQVNMALTLISLFHIIYTLDVVLHDAAFLHSYEFSSTGVGFLMVFGTNVWVPFLLTLQARYIYLYDNEISHANIALCLVLFFCGWIIFRVANSQKNSFRRNPNNYPNAKVVKTGVKDKDLLISGLWGLCRHPNYLGDMLIGLSFGLCTGFSRVLPYFYTVYIFAFLILREMNDRRVCAKKYKEAWKEYEARVPYKIIPYVY